MSVISAATAALTALVLGSWLLLAVTHADDRFLVGHVSGAWMALAEYANKGVLYPPLYHSGHYGGTRYMPLQIVLNAGSARITGEYLMSGKLAAYLVAAILVASLIFVLRAHFHLPLWLAGGLVATVLATPVGRLDTLSIRGDTLPVALQLVALALVSRRVDRRSVVIAALLCAAAVLAKQTAFWAVLAISVWLLGQNRRRLVGFLGAFVISVGAALAIIQVSTGGRFADNVLGLSTSALLSPQAALTQAPTRFLSFLQHDAAATWVLVPLALAGWLFAAARRRLGLYHLSLAFATAITVLIMADVGAEQNHLLDVVVLTALVVGVEWSTCVSLEPRNMILMAVIPLAILWGTAASYLDGGMWADTKAAASAAVGRGPDCCPANPLKGYVGVHDDLMSEDPGLEVSLGRLPTILDPFMFLRTAATHPEWENALIKRLDHKEFDEIVLRAGAAFAPGVRQAIARNYRPAEAVDPYRIYRPRAGAR